MTADTVTNYEVVTAAAEIVNANKDENEDLFYALKGGGNQFAIVTEFTFQTFSIDKVWGKNFRENTCLLSQTCLSLLGSLHLQAISAIPAGWDSGLRRGL